MAIHPDLLEAICSRESLPDAERFASLVESARVAMEETAPEIRPRDPAGQAGGLIRLTGGLPTILVPDLHARRGFFRRVLEYPVFDGQTVLEALSAGTVRVVCVGDAFHSEYQFRFRWLMAHEEYLSGMLDGPSLTAEIADSMGLMEMILECISAYPEHFFFLKGNHENILNTEANGNHPFRKYADEGEMFYDFFVSRFGIDFTSAYARLEETFPLCVVAERFMVSHAEPRRYYDTESIINARLDPEVVEGLTWTGNGESEEGTVERMVGAFLPDAPDALYFGGHRPVQNTYALRASDRFVQIHNPSSEQIAFISPERAFNFITDIRSVEP